MEWLKDFLNALWDQVKADPLTAGISFAAGLLIGAVVL